MVIQGFMTLVQANEYYANGIKGNTMAGTRNTQQARALRENTHNFNQKI
jgi:hypothetical protein